MADAKRDTVEHKGSFFGDLGILYKSREHRNSLYAVLGIWVYCALNYYIINYYVKYFPGDIFVNFLTMTIAEVLAPLILRFL